MWQGSAYMPRAAHRPCHFTTAAPSLARAARRRSSAISVRLAAIRASFWVSRGTGVAALLLASGACRNLNAPTACQPKNRFTRSITTADLMLDLDRARALDPQDDGARFRQIASHWPRPADSLGLAMGRDV